MPLPFTTRVLIADRPTCPSRAPTRYRVRVQSLALQHPLAMIAVGLLLYSTGPVLSQASQVNGPVFGFWRLWLGVPVMGLAALLMLRAGGRWPDLRAWRWSLWAGLCFGGHQLFFFSAIKATSVTDVALMNVLSPIVVALVALPLFGERPGSRFGAWTLVAIGGAAIVVLGATAGPQGNPLGMAMAAGNVAFFAGFFLLSKRGREEIDVLPFLFGVIAVAALSVSAFALLTSQPVTEVQRNDVLLALVVAVGPGAFGHFLSTWPLHRIPANVPPVMRLAQPIFSAVLAYLFLAEPITGNHLTGGVMTIAGVFGAVLSPGGLRQQPRQAGQRHRREVQCDVKGNRRPQEANVLVQQRRYRADHQCDHQCEGAGGVRAGQKAEDPAADEYCGIDPEP